MQVSFFHATEIPDYQEKVDNEKIAKFIETFNKALKLKGLSPGNQLSLEQSKVNLTKAEFLIIQSNALEHGWVLESYEDRDGAKVYTLTKKILPPGN